ncbi:hypothetical protein AVEN_252823-1 [Araneus ventricosus]|uniref:Secreted protein n=1 Tax=Araneus ventricosus TaxID=182803 RepID=A0A4Y2CMA1_ARAVE|nr:hypothetical protein AVEN_252823-1 [Araneus ventricosus]
MYSLMVTRFLTSALVTSVPQSPAIVVEMNNKQRRIGNSTRIKEGKRKKEKKEGGGKRREEKEWWKRNEAIHQVWVNSVCCNARG